MLTDNEILAALRDGCMPLVNFGLHKLGNEVRKVTEARILSGELIVRVEAEFGARLNGTCQIIDAIDGAVAYEFSLEGLQRITVTGKSN